MSPMDLPQSIRFSPWQLWRYFREPMAMHNWLRERYGEIVSLHLEGQDYVAVLTAEGARQVFSADPAGYEAFWKTDIAGLSGPGSLWVLDGAKHRRERQLLSPAFHTRHFHAYGEIIRQLTRCHLDPWQPGQTVRAIDTTLAISRDVILHFLFGGQEDELMREGSVVLEALWRTVHPLIVFFPKLRRRWFPIWRRYARARAEMYAWLDRLLVARRARGGETDDVLGRLLAARGEDGNPMPDAAIRDELSTILLAGHETTATALAWALYELGRHPAAVQKLRAELESPGPVADPGSIVTLPYLSAVCNEAMRLHTLVPEVPRVVAAPLELFGHTLPVGSSVVVSAMSVHHDPELYPQPDQFIPERFLRRSYTPSEFLPFGGGHRRCLGAGISDYELRTALAEIITHWEFEAAAVEREIRHDIAMGPKYGVPLRIKARRQPGPKVEPALSAQPERAPALV